MAVLQVAINPLLRTAGGEEHFAFNSVFAQLFFGGASYISPQIYSYLVSNLNSEHAYEFVLIHSDNKHIIDYTDVLGENYKELVHINTKNRITLFY